MSGTLPPERFEPELLMEALTDADVAFILIGALAVGVHGAVRATSDVDIVPDPDPDNLERLAAVLRALGARQIGIDTDALPKQPTDAAGLAAGGSFQLATRHGQLDILQESAVIPSHATLAEDAIEIDWRGHPVRVCSLPHLRAMKRAADRPVDRLDLDALAEAHGDGDS
jgi:hypothetical protein